MSSLWFLWALCLCGCVRNQPDPDPDPSPSPGAHGDQPDPDPSPCPGAHGDQPDPQHSLSPGADRDQPTPDHSPSPGAHLDQPDIDPSPSPGEHGDQPDPDPSPSPGAHGDQPDPDPSLSPGAHGDQPTPDHSPSPGAHGDQRDPDPSPPLGARKGRKRRSLTQSDMLAILDYHNQVRAHVYPPAANMELMQWDTGLAEWAAVWAASCQWEHGPAPLLTFYGQNLSVRTGGYQSVLQLLTPWFEEVYYYMFPYPHMCRPLCPLRCYAPMCTHYTQMVWATTSSVGCALHTCTNMSVWGSVWREAAFLVCNYSPKGNWIGEAPYSVGVPCSMCPSVYRGRCSNNLCVPKPQSNYVSWFK